MTHTLQNKGEDEDLRCGYFVVFRPFECRNAHILKFNQFDLFSLMTQKVCQNSAIQIRKRLRKSKPGGGPGTAISSDLSVNYFQTKFTDGAGIRY